MAGSKMWIMGNKGKLHALQPKRSYKKKAKNSYSKARTINPGKGGSGLLGAPCPFPLVWKGAKQSYSQTKSYTVGGSGVFGTENVFNLNSQFDPDSTGVGHQPYARDTFATLYSRYKVKAVTIDVMFTNPSAQAIACGVAFINPSNTGATGNLAGKSYDAVKERPLTIVKVLQDTGAQSVRIRKTFPLYKLLGVTKLQFDADIGIYDAAKGDDPQATGLSFMRVAIADLNLGSAATCTIAVKITMHTDWYERITLGQS